MRYALILHHGELIHQALAPAFTIGQLVSQILELLLNDAPLVPQLVVLVAHMREPFRVLLLRGRRLFFLRLERGLELLVPLRLVF
jgi:hypothetical protein